MKHDGVTLNYFAKLSMGLYAHLPFALDLRVRSSSTPPRDIARNRARIRSIYMMDPLDAEVNYS